MQLQTESESAFLAQYVNTYKESDSGLKLLSMLQTEQEAKNKDNKAEQKKVNMWTESVHVSGCFGRRGKKVEQVEFRVWWICSDASRLFLSVHVFSVLHRTFSLCWAFLMI